MSDNQDLDLEKWGRPATGGEVAQGLLQCRLAHSALLSAINAAHSGDQAAWASAFEKFAASDRELQRLINIIGGLSGRPR